MMTGMGKLLLLFILVPAVELALLIELGRHIGTLATLAIIAITGLVGAFLARRQGMGVLRQMRAEIVDGRLPAGSLVDGVIILLAGALLITPGLLTDIFGFLCLIPGFRKIIKAILRRWFERAVREGKVRVSTRFDAHVGPPGSRPVHDTEPDPDSRPSLPHR